MDVQTVPIDSLSLDPANVRRHPTRNLEAIAASLRRFGQQKPIVVDAKGIVRAGNGTLEAARTLGWTEIRVTRTELKGSEATAFAIADNRSAELAEWESEDLAATLGALRDEGIDLGDVGFSDEELDGLLGQPGMDAEGDRVDDPEGEWGGMPECENEDKPIYRSLHVHFAGADDLKRFSEAIGQEISEKASYIWFPARSFDRPSKTPYVNEP